MRDSLKKLQEAVKNQRQKANLPESGPIDPVQLLKALRKNPPLDQLTRYVKSRLNNPRSGNG